MHLNAEALFQFHEGPIKTGRGRPQKSRSLFQFHEGPIKTEFAQPVLKGLYCFNSMKVRLKRIGRAVCSGSIRFQFHEGPIKTKSRSINTELVTVSIP